MARLFTDKGNPQAFKALIAARYNGVDIDVPVFDAASRDSNEFAKKSPLAKIPVLETPQGSLWESNAITRYIARLGNSAVLYGSTPFETSLIDNWIEYSANEIELPANVWVYPILGYIPNNAIATNKAKADVRKALDFLNKHLLTRTFLVGERISLADIVVAVGLLKLYERVLDGPFRKPFVNTNRWFLTVINQPHFKGVVGDVKLCEKMEIAPEGAPAAAEKKETPPKKEKEPKKEAPKKETKPKPKEPEEEEPEENYDDEPKNKNPNPLDLLPPSKLNLEEWKRVYSNEATRPTALNWFWDHYDAEGYSIWIGDYKYNNECEKLFMTLNLLGGFIQRLEKVRKYAFGSLIIFGDEPKLEVSCVFLFRGKELPEVFTIVDDVEHYAWRKVDPKDNSVRELINDYFAWDGSFGGRKFNQAKIFK